MQKLITNCVVSLFFQLPVIGADWWEPITDNLTSKLYGQVQILVAFGSEKQIHNLELNRGFWDEEVVVKKSRKINTIEKVSESLDTTKTSQDRSLKPHNTNIKEPRKEKVVTSKFTKPKLFPKKAPQPIAQSNKEDKAIQSDEKMENTDKSNNDEVKSVNKDTLGDFLSILMQQRHTNNCVESSTNTEENLTNFHPPSSDEQNSVEVRQTSQLLDTLQEALSVNSNTLFCNNTSLNENRNSFKAHIHIEKALHLPVKKKCKVKKCKGKNIKQEEIQPSCYVSFETTPNEMKVTSIIQKKSNPIWDYRCDITLPADLLVNVRVSNRLIIIR